jgi:hypothetical protein
MPSEIADPDDGLPWLSWAMTGILTLAGVLITGLVISARNPRSATAQTQSPAATRPQDANNPLPSISVASIDPPAAASSQQATSQPSPTQETHKESARPVAAVQQPSAPQPKPSAIVPVPVDRAPPEPIAVKPPVHAAPATVDPAKHAAFVRAAAEVRSQMARRDLAASKQKLQAATAEAQNPADQTELERLEILQDHLEKFWAGISSAVAVMQPVEEIVLSESNRVAVIEASRSELAVQWEGRQQRFRIKGLPKELLWAITKKSFEPTSGSKLIVGAFLAMDAAGDRTQAARLWQDAIRGGEEEGKVLMPELEVPRGGR